MPSQKGMVGPFPRFLSAVAMAAAHANKQKPVNFSSSCPSDIHFYPHSLTPPHSAAFTLHLYLRMRSIFNPLDQSDCKFVLIDPPIARASLLGNLDYQLHLRYITASITNPHYPGSINLRLLELQDRNTYDNFSTRVVGQSSIY